MARKGRRKRSVATKDPRSIVRILCEGSVTEPEYLTMVAGENVVLDVQETGQAPKSLVNAAWEHVTRNRGRKLDRDFDEIWCVFDRDDHDDIAGTLQTARDRGIEVAFSNPCFELWLVLHVEDQQAHIERQAIQRRCEELGLTEGKSIASTADGRLKSGLGTARLRAKRLSEMHRSAGADSRSNPSSTAWRLVDRLRR